MEYICGITFAPFAARGRFATDETKKSLVLMREGTAANFVIFVPNGVQQTAQSEEICYTASATMSDDELEEMIAYAQSLGFRVALKPTANCANGTWRAHINFFDEDVPCEPKWGNWFASYTKFQLHYAKIAQKCGCEMFLPGCEMVMSEHREGEWRKLIADIRTEYHGLISYNTDKYQEHRVKWWDAVDVISSSGYYPIDDWEHQLDRIETVVKHYQKPFFFAEAGCMSVTGSPYVPNNWEIQGKQHPGNRQTGMRRCLQHVQRETGCGEWRSGPGEENFIPVSRHWHIGTMRYMQNRQNRWLRPGTADGSMLETNRILTKISLQSV